MSPEDKKEELIRLVHKQFGCAPDNIVKLSGGGSSREYFRLFLGNKSVIGVIGEDRKENRVFIDIDRCLHETGINVPEVIGVSDDFHSYLLEDLGDESLFRLLNSPEKMVLAEKAIDTLVDLQKLPENVWIDKVGYPPFSSRLIKWDLNYFKYDFLKPRGVLFDEDSLEDDFELMTEKLSSPDIISGFMYRDFQSRNIMVKDDALWLIDFQGARKGPAAYDAASFIWQAKAPFSYEEREKLCLYYLNEYSQNQEIFETLKSQLWQMVLFRTLQVLGAYGFRGLIERKKHFIESIPFALRNLKYLQEKGIMKDYPELEKITERLTSSNLTLTVLSFSYKKGYPEDPSGNGGGFMFDCRGINNPGRYEEYKTKTGRDKEVKEFLEQTTEASSFIKKAVEMVTPTIDVYLSRGFTSLQVGFGCTGGQHRSVYCADEFARKIKELYPQINVDVIHREQRMR